MLALNEENFKQTVTENDTVIVDFWAPWCGPCRQFGPIFEKVSQEYADDSSIVFAKLDTEEQPRLGAAMGVQSIPTIMAFKKGALVYNQPGAMNATMFKKLVEKIREFDVDEALASEGKA